MTTRVYVSRISARYVSLIITAFGSGCATVTSADVPFRPLVAQSKPACAEEDTDKIGGKECTRRNEIFMTMSIAATVRIDAFVYEPEKGTIHNVGTAVIIEEGGTLLTAYHVIKDADFITATVRRTKGSGDGNVFIIDHRSFPVEVAYVALKRDVAILTTKYPEKKKFLVPMRLRTGMEPILGEHIMHFGQTSLVQRGTTEVWPVKVDATSPLMTVTGVAKGGDSGGPVVALDGRLIGIVIAHNEPSIKEDDDIRRMYYMPIDYALRALRPWFMKTRVREVPVKE